MNELYKKNELSRTYGHINDLFSDNGYLNVNKLIDSQETFIFCTGGRGTGKTYGVLKYVLEHKIKFMHWRRTRSEAQKISKDKTISFKKINEDLGTNIKIRPLASDIWEYYDGETGEGIGYLCAMLSMADDRGIDFSDVDLIIYDEFIPEDHKKRVRGEGTAFDNAYETIARNRELENRPPVKLIALSNSNALNNALYAHLDFLGIAAEMKKEKIKEMHFLEYDAAIFFLDGSPISERKKETALYKLTKRTNYSSMALNNDFEDLKEHTSAKRNLKEFIPVCLVADIAIYRHKSNGKYFVTQKRAGAFRKVYGDSATEKHRFLRQNPLLYDRYLKRKIEFSDFASESKFKNIIE